MTDNSFSVSLVRKSERAIQIARLSLENEDPDSAVNRSYYAMFNISRAALLKAGVPEGELPRTHRGINEAFRQHAVLTGKIDPELASALSRAESLRLMADYTATEIDADAATKLVEQEENYVRTVKRIFDLQQTAGLEEDWLNLRRQQNRPIKEGEKRDPSADLGRGERANDSAAKGSDDDLDP